MCVTRTVVLISLFAIATVSAPVINAQSVNLGPAGSYAVFAGADAKFSLNGPSAVAGNIAIGANGQINWAGPATVAGTAFEDVGVGGPNSGVVPAGGFVHADLTSAALAAINASANAAALPPTTSVAGNTIVSTNASQSLTVNSNVPGGPTVLSLQDVILNSGDLTFNGGPNDTFIVNVSGQFSINDGASIQTAGGVTPAHILFNITGPGSDVSVAGSTASSISGTLLAPSRNVSFHDKTLNGAIIAGFGNSSSQFQISITSAGRVNFQPFFSTGQPSVFLSLSCPAVTGQVGMAYFADLDVSGGTGPFTLTVVSGSLPSGLTLNSNGTITGTPTAAGTFNATINVTDSLGASATTSSSCGAITISPATNTPTPNVVIHKNHTGVFREGDTGKTYTLIVSNVGTAATSGMVTVSDTLPPGLTATAISGSGWTCVLGTLVCTRTDALAAGSSFSPITVTVNVAANAAPSVANTATVSVGGTTNAAIDVTAIVPALPNGGITPLSVSCPPASGQVGVAYFAALSASGGTAPYTFSLGSGSLPTGLTLNGNGTITGTPTATGTFSFNIKATDAVGDTATSNCTTACLNNSAILDFTSPLGALGTVQAYTQNGITITAYGFNNAGNPMQLFSKNDGGDEVGLGLAGLPESEISTTTFIQLDLSAAIAAGANNATMAVGGVQSGEGYNIYGSNTLGTRGTLLLSGTSDAVSFAMPGFPNFRYISVQASSGNVTLGAESFTVGQCTITISPAAILPSPLSVSCPASSGQVGVAFSSMLTVTGGTGPFTFTITSGALPSGLKLNSNGTISGVPTAAGTFNVTIQVTDSTGATVTTSCGVITISPNTVAPQPLSISCPTATGQVGVSYSATLNVTGGTAPYTFSVGSGALPAGWILNSNGTISGIPTTAGSFNATIQVTDSTGATATTAVANCGAIVIASASPSNLTIEKTLSGTLTPGAPATYTIIVSNNGETASSGMVTVTDQLPALLTAAAISGSGWACTMPSPFAPLGCTRSDSLAAGASYPPIIVTVDVSPNAPACDLSNGDTAFKPGNVFLSMADGSVQWRASDGTLIRTLTGVAAAQAKGMALNASGDLLVTHWIGAGNSGNNVSVYDPAGNMIGLFGYGYSCNPSSLALDASGNVFVGQADCGAQVMKFDSTGNLLASFPVAVENRGSSHIALASDGCTLMYTSEGPNVKRYNVCTNTQLADFNTAALPGAAGAQEFAIMPDGGLLVANTNNIARLDANGGLTSVFTPAGSQCWLGAALDPDGATFWASNWCDSSVAHMNLSNGATLSTFVASSTPFMVKQIMVPPGVCTASITNTATVSVAGSATPTPPGSSTSPVTPPPQPPVPTGGVCGRMTGGGTVMSAGETFSHGFELHCDTSQNPNNLEINFDGNQFKLDSMTSVSCTENASLPPANGSDAMAGFNTLQATGTGTLRLNGVKTTANISFLLTAGDSQGTSGSTPAVWGFSITENGNVIVTVPQTPLSGGSQVAHKCTP